MSIPAPAPGETNLTTLLSTLVPRLSPHTYVFLTLPQSTNLPPTLEPLMAFRESEGVTIICTRAEAVAHELESWTFECRMVTLMVHSSLEAVGFLAVITRELALRG
ncbi:hypothetical protein LSUE1_G010289, partial [Lachnellula suecica]